MYYHIKTAQEIPVAFVSCLGGLLSTVARDVQLEISTTENSDFVKLLVPIGYTIAQNICANTHNICIGMGDLASEQERNFIYTLNVRALTEQQLDQIKWPVLTVTLKYTDADTNKVIESFECVEISRRPKLEKPEPNIPISVQTNRIKMAIACHKANYLASRADFINAIDCLKKTKEEIQNSPSNQEDECVQFIKQLSDLVTSMRDAKAYNNGGNQRATSFYASNAYQQASTYAFTEGNFVEATANNDIKLGSGYMTSTNIPIVNTTNTNTTNTNTAPRATQKAGGYVTSPMLYAVLEFKLQTQDD